MTFAVAGILGHNTKTLLLFFVPQLVNFLYSLPQLLKIIPCPRHRMPGYLPKTDQLCNSYAEFDEADLGAAGRLVLFACERLRLAKVVRIAPASGPRVVRLSNLTIINFVLYVHGPMHEANLTSVLLLLQLACNVLALLVRYQLAGLFYEVVR